MTDFGADQSFAKAATKVKEHYGIEVPVGAVRTKTEVHGEAMPKNAPLPTGLPDRPGVPQLIAELDGSMIPQVEIASAPNGQERVDRRKLRQLKWTEARLCLAHEPGSVSPVFGVSLAARGGPDAAGLQLLQCAIRAGAGNGTKLHCLGDGAVWIPDQVEQHFGLQAEYLVDFYHISEYLAAAAKPIAGDDSRAWRQGQQQKLKENRAREVLDELQPFQEPDTVSDANAPVRACSRYITNRLHQLDYQTALRLGLPIGSGEVESAHGYVIQDRLKLSGAWWTLDNAANMLALRVTRANGDWSAYWDNLYQHAA